MENNDTTTFIYRVGWITGCLGKPEFREKLVSLLKNKTLEIEYIKFLVEELKAVVQEVEK